MARPGYLKLWRGIVEKPIWKQSTPEHKAILIQILIMADFSGNEWEYKGEKYTTKPGQFVTSLKSIAEECGKGISVQNVRSALARFERLGFITNESTKVNRLITIVNWGVYQSNEEKTNKDTNIVTNSEVTKNQQRGNKEVTTKEEVKKKRNKEVKKEYKKKINAFDFFQENGFGVLNQYTAEDMNHYIESFDNDSDEIVQAALKIALDRNKTSWGYAKSILNNWLKANLKSMEEIKAYEQQQIAQRTNNRNYYNSNTKSKEITPEWLLNREHENKNKTSDKQQDKDFEKDRAAFLKHIQESWGGD
ncbi:DnaD domain-containing protein [Staphylococcus simulans]|uniref:DnaD domain-containing protein n=1 Tax=Staphylococcus simulans TaxID=1286 RepID=UPI000D1EE538|nr:DnaD domain protein [Staphylococcus simulans]PTJ91662.1 DNA replication protein DnaD [Staphylococcus simulans]